MKKLLAGCLTIVLIVSLVCCGAAHEAEISWANWTENPKIIEHALNKQQLESDSRHLPIFKCSTLTELNTFKADFNGIFVMDDDWDEVPSFETVTADFDEAFFKENSLLLIYVEANSCSYRFGVEEITAEGDTLTVSVKQKNHPGDADEAMAGWLISLPVAHTELEGIANFDAVLKIALK